MKKNNKKSHNNSFLTLLGKIKNDTATPKEKLALSRRLNSDIQEVNDQIDGLILEMKKKITNSKKV